MVSARTSVENKTNHGQWKCTDNYESLPLSRKTARNKTITESAVRFEFLIENTAKLRCGKLVYIEQIFLVILFGMRKIESAEDQKTVPVSSAVSSAKWY